MSSVYICQDNRTGEIRQVSDKRSCSRKETLVILDMPPGEEGPVGPQGPIGVTGSSGAIGPAGPNGTGHSLVVKDANGSVLGPINENGSLLIAVSGGVVQTQFDLVSGIPDRTAAFGFTGPQDELGILYESTDCTGQGYLGGSDQSAVPRMFRYGTVGSYLRRPSVRITAGSVSYFDGIATICAPSSQTVDTSPLPYPSIDLTPIVNGAPYSSALE